MDIRRIATLASALTLAAGLQACSSDDSGSAAGNDAGGTGDTSMSDTGSDTSEGSGDDAGMGGDAGADGGGGGGGQPLTVTFTLRNGNPGGLSRWVQLRTNIDTPGWWSIQEDSPVPTELGTHDSCALDNCGEDATECPDETAEIFELTAGGSISDTWDLTLYERVQENATTCEQAYQATEARYRVNLCWSPNPPVDGVLPAGTISCTRLPFNIGVDSEVTYAIEGQSTCGDGDCDPGETSIVCPEDCSGVTTGVVQLSCNQYCNQLFVCDENVRRDECQVGCSDQAAELATASEECLQAVADYFTCLSTASCDALAAETACTIEQGAAASACN